MSFTQSAEHQLEQAIVPLFSAVTGLNVYTTNRTGSRLFPYVSISATPARQPIGPYSGVYEMSVAINYSQTSAKYSKTQFDEQYLDVFGSLYSTPTSLREKIENGATDLKVYMARVSAQNPTINVGKRAWQKGIMVSAIVTPELAVFIYSYEFDDDDNSFYLATI
jgi:hypothetical protein